MLPEAGHVLIWDLQADLLKKEMKDVMRVHDGELLIGIAAGILHILHWDANCVDLGGKADLHPLIPCHFAWHMMAKRRI